MKKLLLTSFIFFSVFCFGIAQAQQSTSTLSNKKQTINRDAEPRFELVPDYYAFGSMGPIDDGYLDSDTATFTVINEGYESFNMTHEPYFFSGHHDSFECIDTNTYDYLVDGPYTETGTSYNFKVVFKPDYEGELHSLLVTEDDIVRMVRTTNVEGKASYYGYVPGIGENKSSGTHGISEDWLADPDYDLAGNFDNYVNDYQLDPTATADLVFHIDLSGKSEVTFDHFQNITDLALFEAGIQVLEENNIYNDEPITLEPGVYYIVVSGNDKFKFKTTVIPEDNPLILPPEEVTAELNDDETVATINWNSPLENRELLHYMVYRFHEEDSDNPADWALLSDSVENTSYIDSSWQDLSMGVYQFGVKSVYTDTVSEAALSNSLEKDMYSNVIIYISTNSGEVVEDAIIELIGSDTTITDTIDIPGSFNYSALPIDIYTINIYADGYETYSGYMEVTEPYYIYEIMLIESLVPPENIMSSVACDDVHLTWEYQSESPSDKADRAFSGFNIYRNNELLNSSPITDTTYTDMNVPPGIYSYEVTSIYTTGESESIQTQATIQTLLPASDLSAQHHEESDVLVEWVAPSSGTTLSATAELTGYHLYRASSFGDTVVFELPVTDSYLDENPPVPANEVTYAYWVLAQYDGGCLAAPSNVDTVTFISDNIENPGKEEVLVFPNPSHKAFYIKLKSKSKQIEIVNSLGQIVYQKLNPGNDLIHISDLESGVYSLKVVLLDSTIISKTIIVSR